MVAQLTSQGARKVVFSALTMSHRGVWSEQSFKEMKTLGLTSSQLKVLTVCAIEGGVFIWHVFRKSTAWAWKRTRDKLRPILRLLVVFQLWGTQPPALSAVGSSYRKV